MTFQQASAVWIDDHQAINQFVGFYAAIRQEQSASALLHLAAVNDYRLFLNGAFIAHGPARCAHGFARIDQIALQLQTGLNHIAIEVAAYHINSFEHLDQPGFLCAELCVEEKVHLATPSSFTAQRLSERIGNVQRYSFQRPTSEAYVLHAQTHAWRTQGIAAAHAIALSPVAGYQFLERHAPLPNYPLIVGNRISDWACVYTLRDDYQLDRAQKQTGPKLKGCLTKDIELNVRQILAGCVSTPQEDAVSGRLKAGDAIIFDLARNRSGFIQCSIECKTGTHVIISFDERLDEAQDVNFTRLDCINAISYQLEAGSYDLESFAPYTARYLKVHVYQGSAELRGCGMRGFENPAMFFTANYADPILQEISVAAQHTISQNSVDVFMDCPSRERAGWLCDSFFMGRYERVLATENGVEQDFLENFLLPDEFTHLPTGMLPMCYPSDHYDGCFIPQWSLWYVLEFIEYTAGDRGHRLFALAKQRLAALFAWFSGYENSDGLVEDMPGWNFIEWSKANQLVKGVNYPSNMLYAAALSAYGEYFNQPSFTAKAQALKRIIVVQAWDGTWFHDQALRDESGVLQLQEHRTEVCQYYALYFDFKPAGWQQLWKCLVANFGSHYNPNGSYVEIYPANAFIGYVLRIDLLSKMEDPQIGLEEIKGLYGHMAATTGTLWEHKDTSASCNHGFAGYIALKIQELTLAE